jgi:hypothetical protein
LVIRRFASFGAVLAYVPWLLFPREACAADVLVKSYLSETRPEFREYNKLFFDGVTSGFRWYNSGLQADGKQPLFCLPSHFEIKFEQAEDIMMGWVKRHPQFYDNSYISGALLAGLIEIFPCKN